MSVLNFNVVMMEDVINKQINACELRHVVNAVNELFSCLGFVFENELFTEMFYYAKIRADNFFYSPHRAYALYASHVFGSWKKIRELAEGRLTSSNLSPVQRLRLGAAIKTFSNLCSSYENLSLPPEEELTERILCVLGEDADAEAYALERKMYEEQLDLMEWLGKKVSKDGNMTNFLRWKRLRRIHAAVITQKCMGRENGPTFAELFELNATMARFLTEKGVRGGNRNENFKSKGEKMTF